MRRRHFLEDCQRALEQGTSPLNLGVAAHSDIIIPPGINKVLNFSMNNNHNV